MDYFGPTVNRSARVSGVSQGGQILVSDKALDQVKKETGDLNLVIVDYSDALAKPIIEFWGLFCDWKYQIGKLVVQDLGEFKLKGLQEPTQIYSVIEERFKDRKFAPANQNNEEKEQKKSLEEQIKMLKRFVTKNHKKLLQLVSHPFKLTTRKLFSHHFRCFIVFFSAKMILFPSSCNKLKRKCWKIRKKPRN